MTLGSTSLGMGMQDHGVYEERTNAMQGRKVVGKVWGMVLGTVVDVVLVGTVALVAMDKWVSLVLLGMA